MNKIKTFAVLFTIAFSIVSFGAAAIAQPSNPRQADGPDGSFTSTTRECTGSGALPLPTWHQYLPKDSNCNIANDGLDGSVVVLVLLGIFDIILFIAGFAAIVFVIWGGFKYLTSAGESQKAASAKTTITNAIVGLVIAFVASSLVGYIAGRIG